VEVNGVYIGMEELLDSFGAENLGDYNDIIVKVQVLPTPHIFLHLGSGLIGLGVLGLRKKT
jgi:hypothetical protein